MKLAKLQMKATSNYTHPPFTSLTKIEKLINFLQSPVDSKSIYPNLESKSANVCRRMPDPKF